MNSFEDEIVVAGWSCRLPGANSIAELWSLLIEGRCAISQVPDNRFVRERFGHPRRQERGKSYTWAAGVLDDIWGFDPTLFGISPRESEQMDPQQRILLQLTWEALEDAGILPSTLAGAEVGVFVGGSLTEYSHGFSGDPAIADSHYATGNALAALANRISYIFDLRGPSVTIDTACSSSLVALHQALEALRSGRIDTAIVGGINIIASPFSFIGFSQASMLSPTGLCQSFSAAADGFVRAEGGAVLVLRKAHLAYAMRNPIHGTIVASEVNSDGRTNGISLPSVDAQERLLKTVYARAGIEPDMLAFVEAHGTGTAVGDPIEAGAIGRILGPGRSNPLPIGSIKSNIGHLEPASGVAGVLKALLALKHGVLPASLHFNVPSPNIDFQELKLTVCTQARKLADASQNYAGVNSFGFGGTNAHIVIAKAQAPSVLRVRRKSSETRLLAISAETKPALTALAQKYAHHLAALSDEDPALTVSAAGHRRDRLSHGLVVSGSQRGDLIEALNAFAGGEDHGNVVTGVAEGRDLPVTFIYNGNGSQWAGMGISAYKNNSIFRAGFERVDAYFKPLAGWSLVEEMFSDTLADRLKLTSVAQPLIFAIQSATTAALAHVGLRPSAVLGHSVGEIAAAEAAGILDLNSAVRLVYFRSMHQELVRGAGRMLAVLCSSEQAAELVEKAGDFEIAAFNSARAVTLAGPTDRVEAMRSIIESKGIACLDLWLDYPFHSALMAPVEGPLIADLHGIIGRDAEIPFISTVTGACLPGSRLDANYWWRNVREPVQFSLAIRAAADLGGRFFLEIGPRRMLLKHISDNLNGVSGGYKALSVLDRGNANGDPFQKTAAKAIVAGASIDKTAIFGNDPGGTISLPSYAWQQKQYRFESTHESHSIMDGSQHPLAGSRRGHDTLEWRSIVDTALMPELADHRLGDQAILPGTAFLEIGLAVAQQWLRCENITIANIEILRALDLSHDEAREIMTRVSPETNTFEIFSRPRLSAAAWLLHCRGKMLRGNGPNVTAYPTLAKPGKVIGRDELYQITGAIGLNYGQAFRLVNDVTIHEGGIISVELRSESNARPFILDPIRLDCCTHGILLLPSEFDAEKRGVAYIPVRLEEATLFISGAIPQRTMIEVRSKSDRSILADYHIFGMNNERIAYLRGVRCQAVPFKRQTNLESIALAEFLQPVDGIILGNTGFDFGTEFIVNQADTLKLFAGERTPSGRATELLEEWATAVAYIFADSFTEKRKVRPDALIAAGRLGSELRPWLINILMSLTSAGLAEEIYPGCWSVPKASIAQPADLVKRLAEAYPERVAELLLAGEITQLSLRTKKLKTLLDFPSFTNAVLDFYDVANLSNAKSNDLLVSLLETIQKTSGAENRTIRILQIGARSLTKDMAWSSAARNIQLTVIESERRQDREHGRPKDGNVVFLNAEHSSDLGIYDLIIASDGLQKLPCEITLSDLRQKLAPGGLLIGIASKQSLFSDIVFGSAPGWFTSGTADFPMGALCSAQEWQEKLKNAGFADSRAVDIHCGDDVATLVLAKTTIDFAAPSAAPGLDQTALVVGGSDPKELSLAAAVAQYLNSPSINAPILTGDLRSFIANKAAGKKDSAGKTVIQFLIGSQGRSDSVGSLSEICLTLKACAEAIGTTKTVLWLIFRGAQISAQDGICPVASGAWAFSRTFANEFPNLDVRRIDIAPTISDERAAAAIVKVILSGTAETELHIDHKKICAVRIEPIRRIKDMNDQNGAEAAQLQRQLTGGPRLKWQPIDRVSPVTAEIEIAVEATGLNFRDLMWMLSLLPDDILEDGFTGPTLGLECAGRITRLGQGVTDLKVGDRVAAFARSAFSTHVTVSADFAIKIPDGISNEAAATIPVAFLTAYYSLVTLANIKRGEWVLIHGGAGGVGLAAIQIAQMRGAKIIATAGSKAKRALLETLGVRHVLDSRTTEFVEHVRTITADGVDIVLNSLAGDAMEGSIACLRSYGRFIELGKRDYVENSHVGLRPFRKNLSYFGVDIDQLIAGRAHLGRKILLEIERHLDKGTLTPLPYCVFEANNVSDAFNVMQQSAHIGKIIVRPPKPGTIKKTKSAFKIDVNGTHLITGGLGGFGLVAAEWLADQGVRHLVLVGRSGPSSDEAQTALRSFAERGIQVLAEPCDVADAQAIAALFDKVRATMPPLVGVLHAAMVLEDAIIANIDADGMRRVLLPKVKGVENLDLLTRDIKLCYFVAFSSVTTLFGNPGQGSYVAANAYMEGLMRQRRRQGLPGVAIGWGPIIDVGVVARTQKLRAGLQKLTGAQGMTAREALDLMAQALEERSDSPELAVMTVALRDGLAGANKLPALRSPTFGALISESNDELDGAINKLDVRALAGTEDIEIIRDKISDVITAQVAHVLHSRPEDISRTRALAEIGLDSLMAVELAINLEKAFDVHVLLARSTTGILTIAGLADEVINEVYRGLASDSDAVITPSFGRNVEGVKLEQIDILEELHSTNLESTRRHAS